MVRTEATAALLGVHDAAAICGIKRSLFLNMVATGRAPAPLKLGRRTLWRRSDLDSWITAGCPARDAWEHAGA